VLHILNGDSFAARLKESGIEGNILAWRESLYEGPVGLDHADEGLLEARSFYMENKYSSARMKSCFFPLLSWRGGERLLKYNEAIPKFLTAGGWN
jgi:hypothetical protein